MGNVNVGGEIVVAVEEFSDNDSLSVKPVSQINHFLHVYSP